MGFGVDGTYCGWIAVKTAAFILGSFVFSFIFWGVKRWMDKPRKKKK